MGTQVNTTGRNAVLNTHVSQLGGLATAKLYSGTKSLTPTGTLLATLTFGSASILDANGGTAGSVTGGVLTAGGYTQNNANHVSGTPTFVLWSNAAGTAYAATDIGAGSGNIQFSGQVVNGVNITGALSWTAGNP